MISALIYGLISAAAIGLLSIVGSNTDINLI